MRVLRSFLWIASVLMALISCKRVSTSSGDTETASADSATYCDTGSDVPHETGSASAPGPDTATESGSAVHFEETDTPDGRDSAANVEGETASPDTETAMTISTEAGRDSDTGSGSGDAFDTESATDSGTATENETETGRDTGTDDDTGSEGDTGSDTGPDSDTVESDGLVWIELMPYIVVDVIGGHSGLVTRCQRETGVVEACPQTMTWYLSRTDVVTINDDNSITLAGEGTVAIYVEIDDVISNTVWVTITDPSRCEGAIEFPDPNLEAVVRDAAGVPTGEITVFDVRGLPELSSDILDATMAITDLTGIQCFEYLETLSLTQQDLSDIYPLAGLSQLTGLYLGENAISDLSPVATIGRLSFLAVNGNRISDLSPLASRIMLMELDIHNNAVSDLTPLAELTNLMTVDISSNNISDLSPLTELTRLRTLDASSNNISDLLPLAGMTELTFLRLDDNSISDLIPLGGLFNVLLEVSLSNNNLSDLSPLADLSRLTVLDASSNDISNISAVAALRNLHELYLQGNDISDISSLVANEGIGFDDIVVITDNSLDCGDAVTLDYINLLESRGVLLEHDCE